MFGFMRSTRDIAVSSDRAIQSHVEDCSRRYEDTTRAMDALAADLRGKHAENREEFKAIRNGQARMLWGLMGILLAVIGYILRSALNFHITLGGLPGH